MGIHNLNSLFIYNKVVTKELREKIKTIIIDGSNLIITYLSAIVSSIKANSEDQSTLAQQKLNQTVVERYVSIVTQTTDAIMNVLNVYHQSYKNAKFIIIFDSTSNPDYRIKAENSNEFIIIKAKELESLTRAQRRNNDNKVKEIIDRMTVEGYTQDEIDCYLQRIHFDSPDNYFKLVKDVTNYMCYLYGNTMTKNDNSDSYITFISGISETDFVIRSLAFTHADVDNEVLVLSVDTDYLVLLSDVPYVYTKKIQLNNNTIVYPFELWEQTLGVELSYDQIAKLAIIFGCDYNGHSGLITLDSKNNAKNIDMVKALLEPMDVCRNYFMKTRMKKIKDAIKEVYESNIEIDNETLAIDYLVNLRWKTILDLYLNWEFNTDFKYYNNSLLGGNIGDNSHVLTNMITNYMTKFDKLYDNDGNVIENQKEYIENVIEGMNHDENIENNNEDENMSLFLD